MSYNWLKEYTDVQLSPKEFEKAITAKAFPVERIVSLKDRFDHMVVGKVVELKTHPNADKLQIAVTDIGSAKVDIVCGGANLKVDQVVLVALVGAKVRWHGEGDLITLENATIRGVESQGMICAASEVGFEKAQTGEKDIWDLTGLVDAAPGTSFVEAFDMDDTIFDIEIMTNRVDSMSVIGLAREAGAATESNFTFEASKLPEGSDRLDLSVSIEDADLCPRYMAVALDGIRIAPSPLWMQKKLLLAGYKPINNIVDITNYILHEYGQPMHTFDYEKLKDGKIVIRRAKKDEKLLALDDIEYKLADDQLVITDGDAPIAVAGVMGGKGSGTWDGTTSIVFEAAAFNNVSVRRTSRALGLYSQSQLLFEKGLSTEAPPAALARAVELAVEIAHGTVASQIIDERAEEYQELSFDFDTDRARKLIGVEIKDEEMITILERLGFKVTKEDASYKVAVPFWRDHDIEDGVDFTEEVARMYGYMNIPAELPNQRPPKELPDAAPIWEDHIKRWIAAAGFTEFFSLSFVSENDLTRYDIDEKSSVKVHNPLTSDLTHMRPTLIPSVLSGVELNQRNTPAGRVFELASVYKPRKGDLPEERTELVIAHFGSSDARAAYLGIKGVLEMIGRKTGMSFEFTKLEDDEKWHPSQSAVVSVHGKAVGTIGAVSSKYQKAFSIDKPVMMTVLDLEMLIPDMVMARSYEGVAEYPSVSRDLSVEVENTVLFGDMRIAVDISSELIEFVDFVDEYHGAKVEGGKKSVTMSLVFRAPDRTLESDEVDLAMKDIVSKLEKDFSAQIR